MPRRKHRLYLDPATGLVYADPAAFHQFKQGIAGVAGIRVRPGDPEGIPLNLDATPPGPDVPDPAEPAADHAD